MRSVLLLLAWLTAACAWAQQPPLPAIDLTVGMYRIHAEVANDMNSRMQGLMFRKSMPQSAGMLFVFEDSAAQCMWMKNTLIPLSVAFVDAAGTIVNIADMQPQTEDSHCAERPVRYALEMNKGWFAQRGIKPGAKLGGLEKFAPR
ncbi:MAG TPA: DUF192 domain-containing protein [Burkholderiales bacterium]|jgi:uncharacterized membrane protein (UPF0127 family)|nr:DUF192 domain-containing protein [Burkholderiales bacterium]